MNMPVIFTLWVIYLLFHDLVTFLATIEEKKKKKQGYPSTTYLIKKNYKNLSN
jgi:uncharacterized membrane protein